MVAADSIQSWGVGISQLRSTEAHPLDHLVPGLRQGDEAAFTMLYDAVSSELLSFAYGMVSDRQTAEDIVQQTFVELVRSVHKLRGDGRSLRAWLFRSARFGCLDEYRRRQRRPETPSDSLPEVPVNFETESVAVGPELHAALHQLTDRHRTLILLRHVAGLSGEEIARTMKSTRRAVYAALSRAEENFRRALGRDDV